MKRIIIITTSMCLASTAYAGGYRLSLQGQKALGMGHTGVAMTDSSEVVFFNPAGMTSLSSDAEITGGITAIQSETSFQNETSNATAKTDNPLGTPFNIYYSQKHSDNISFGLGLYTPYGNSVEYPDDWAGSHLVNNIELKAIFIQPTVAYQFNEQYSIGLGIAYVTGSVELNRNLDPSTADENGNRSNVTIEASGVDSWGYNIGFLAKPSERLSLGISYRSKIVLEANDEKADFENVPAGLSTILPDTTFDAELILPAELTIGIAFDLTPNTILAVDINRTFWSAYENLDVTFNSLAGTSLNPRNYQDSNIYRFGVQHTISDWAIRGGIYYDETPVKDGFYTPEAARNDSIGFTAGTSYNITKSLQIDASLLILRLKEFDGSFDFVPDNTSGGLVSFGGEYKSTSTALGLGLSYQF